MARATTNTSIFVTLEEGLHTMKVQEQYSYISGELLIFTLVHIARALGKNAALPSAATAKSGAVSAKRRAPNTKFFMYPNPSGGQLSLSTTEEGVLNIYNMQGKKILGKAINSGVSKLNITEVCMPGIYIVKLTNSKGEIHSSTLHYQP